MEEEYLINFLAEVLRNTSAYDHKIRRLLRDSLQKENSEILWKFLLERDLLSMFEIDYVNMESLPSGLEELLVEYHNPVELSKFLCVENNFNIEKIERYLPIISENKKALSYLLKTKGGVLPKELMDKIFELTYPDLLISFIGKYQLSKSVVQEMMASPGPVERKQAILKTQKAVPFDIFETALKDYTLKSAAAVNPYLPVDLALKYTRANDEVARDILGCNKLLKIEDVMDLIEFDSAGQGGRYFDFYGKSAIILGKRVLNKETVNKVLSLPFSFLNVYILSNPYVDDEDKIKAFKNVDKNMHLAIYERRRLVDHMKDISSSGDFLQVLLGSKYLHFQEYAMTKMPKDNVLLLCKSYTNAGSTKTRQAIANLITATPEYQVFSQSIGFRKLKEDNKGLERRSIRLFVQRQVGKTTEQTLGV